MTKIRKISKPKKKGKTKTKTGILLNRNGNPINKLTSSNNYNYHTGKSDYYRYE